jgi:DNA-binding CsgD family transcriptional regulator
MCAEYSLSPRQIEIVLLLLQGKNKKEIASELKSLRGKKRGKPISVKTADNHIQKIYEVLKVHSQYELISLFIPLRNNGE